MGVGGAAPGLGGGGAAPGLGVGGAAPGLGVAWVGALAGGGICSLRGRPGAAATAGALDPAREPPADEPPDVEPAAGAPPVWVVVLPLAVWVVLPGCCLEAILVATVRCKSRWYSAAASASSSPGVSCADSRHDSETPCCEPQPTELRGEPPRVLPPTPYSARGGVMPPRVGARDSLVNSVIPETSAAEGASRAMPPQSPPPPPPLRRWRPCDRRCGGVRAPLPDDVADGRSPRYCERCWKAGEPPPRGSSIGRAFPSSTVRSELLAARRIAGAPLAAGGRGVATSCDGREGDGAAAGSCDAGGGGAAATAAVDADEGGVRAAAEGATAAVDADEGGVRAAAEDAPRARRCEDGGGVLRVPPPPEAGGVPRCHSGVRNGGEPGAEAAGGATAEGVEAEGGVADGAVAADACRCEGGGWRCEGGGWRCEGGGWRCEGGDWRCDGGDWRCEAGGV